MKFKILFSFFWLLSSAYAEEGTTTIPQSELIITGQDKYFLEWKEELPDIDLSFPLMDAPKPKTIEKGEEKIELKLGEKEKITIKEKPPQFVKEDLLPWIKISIGNYNSLKSSILFAKEKRERAGYLFLERERFDGFKWNGKRDFHSQNRDNAEVVFGMGFNEARIRIPFSFLSEEVFLPYQDRDEKRKSVSFKIGYETPYYNNLKFLGSIFTEDKDFVKNRGMGSNLSFDFAKKTRLNLEALNEGFSERKFLKAFFSFYPTKKPFKGKDILIESEGGFSIFKNEKTYFFPELDISLSSKLKKDLILSLLLKNSMDSFSFSSLYFVSPYSTVSTNLKPERKTRLEGEMSFKKQGLSLKNSLFLEGKADCLEWYKKTDGLYSPKNSGSLFSYGISTNVNYQWMPKIDTELKATLMGLSKEINYTPKFEGGVILKYKNGNLFIDPMLIFKGEQKAEKGNISPYLILNISGKREISNEFEAFFNIENLFNNRYKEREDYPGKRLFASAGLKIRL